MSAHRSPPVRAENRPGTTDAVRVRRLRRMKAGAGGLLLFAAVVYALTYLAADGSRGGWGFVRAAAEAAMIGGLADWFAVTALFRRPLGLPIPHTALIPARKDALGRALRDFVGEEFLTPEVLGARITAARLPERAGRWLDDSEHADRVAGEASSAVAALVRLLGDNDLHDVVARALRTRLERESVASRIGALGVPLLMSGAHHDLLDATLERFRDRLEASPDAVIAFIESLAPHWSPRFVDRGVARRLHGVLLRAVREILADPDHPLRTRLDLLLQRWASRLRDDPAVQERVDELIRRGLEHPGTGRTLRRIVALARDDLAAQLENDAELRSRLGHAVRALGARLATDPVWQARAQDLLLRAGDHLSGQYRDELTRIISDTVERWDGPSTARRLELLVGRDLQFVRINGAVVGALAGIAIHGITIAAGG